MTYQAALSPPGGTWSDDLDPSNLSMKGKHIAGTPILRDKEPMTLLIYCFLNKMAFFASMLIIWVCLFIKVSKAVRVSKVLVIAAVFMMVATYITGTLLIARESSKFTTIDEAFIHVLAFALVLVILWLIDFITSKFVEVLDSGSVRVHTRLESIQNDMKEKDGLRNTIVVVAVLILTMTYQAALNPPGGTWPDDPDPSNLSMKGKHIAGTPVLRDKEPMTLLIYCFLNKMAFFASMLIIWVCLFNEVSKAVRICKVLVIFAVFMMVATYMTGTLLIARESSKFTTINETFIHVLAFALVLVILWLTDFITSKFVELSISGSVEVHTRHESIQSEQKEKESLRNTIVVVAVLILTMTYQAALSPPGGTWPDDPDPSNFSIEGKHIAGTPILRDKQPMTLLIYCFLNKMAFFASMLIIWVCLFNEVSKAVRICKVLVIVAVFMMVATYITGTLLIARESSKFTTINEAFIHVLAFALVLVILWLTDFITSKFVEGYGSGSVQDHTRLESTQKEQKKKEDLRNTIVVVAVLILTMTYQAALSPPGGTWSDDPDQSNLSMKGKHIAGTPVLRDKEPMILLVYCFINKMAFFASMLIIWVCLFNEVSKAARICKVLVIAAVFMMVATYIIGTLLIGKESSKFTTIDEAFIHVLAFSLVLVILWLTVFITGKFVVGSSSDSVRVLTRLEYIQKEQQEKEGLRNTIVVVVVLILSMTYQAALSPPGGTWPDEPELFSLSMEGKHIVGTPVLRDKEPMTLLIYCFLNKMAFFASMLIIWVSLFNEVSKVVRICKVLVIAAVFMMVATYITGTLLIARESSKFTTIDEAFIHVLAFVLVLVILWLTDLITSKFVEGSCSGSIRVHNEHDLRKQDADPQ